MLQFDINNYKEIKQLYLHDSELKEVKVDYINKEVRVNLLTAKIKGLPQKQVRFIFRGVTDFHVPINEPWGSGFYLHSITVEEENNLIKTTFMLNSGDEISCVAQLVKTDTTF